jgi:hypothetical protein
MENKDKKRSEESLRKVMKQLTEAAATIKTTSVQGLIEAAILVRRDMEKTAPKTPIDTGNLKHSFFITTVLGTDGKGNFKGENSGEMKSNHEQVTGEAKAIVEAHHNPTLIMGYSANYALWVHEAEWANFTGQQDKIKRTKSGKVTEDTKKYTRREGAGAKWFEYAIQRNSALMLKTMAKEMKI